MSKVKSLPKVTVPAIDTTGDTTGRCISCRHWRENRMECHRHAPRACVFGEMGMLTTSHARTVVWPITAGGDHCGDWERRQ